MSTALINVTRDYEGIRLAAVELFEDSLMQREADRALRNARGTSNRQRLAESFPSKLSYAAGYYAWVEYLLELDGMLEIGAQLPMERLLDTEIKGLRMLRLARQEFSSSHPPCGRCGEPNHRFVQQCASCGAKFQMEKAA